MATTTIANATATIFLLLLAIAAVLLSPSSAEVRTFVNCPHDNEPPEIEIVINRLESTPEAPTSSGYLTFNITAVPLKEWTHTTGQVMYMVGEVYSWVLESIALSRSSDLTLCGNRDNGTTCLARNEEFVAENSMPLPLTWGTPLTYYRLVVTIVVEDIRSAAKLACITSNFTMSA